MMLSRKQTFNESYHLYSLPCHTHNTILMLHQFRYPTSSVVKSHQIIYLPRWAQMLLSWIIWSFVVILHGQRSWENTVRDELQSGYGCSRRIKRPQRDSKCVPWARSQDSKDDLGMSFNTPRMGPTLREERRSSVGCKARVNLSRDDKDKIWD